MEPEQLDSSEEIKNTKLLLSVYEEQRARLQDKMASSTVADHPQPYGSWKVELTKINISVYLTKEKLNQLTKPNEKN